MILPKPSVVVSGSSPGWGMGARANVIGLSRKKSARRLKLQLLSPYSVFPLTGLNPGPPWAGFW